jgi:hypothetical protein
VAEAATQTIMYRCQVTVEVSVTYRYTPIEVSQTIAAAADLVSNMIRTTEAQVLEATIAASTMVQATEAAPGTVIIIIATADLVLETNLITEALGLVTPRYMTDETPTAGATAILTLIAVISTGMYNNKKAGYTTGLFV